MPVTLVQGTGGLCTNTGGPANAAAGALANPPVVGNRLYIVGSIPAIAANVSAQTGWAILGAAVNNGSCTGSVVICTKVCTSAVSDQFVTGPTWTGAAGNFATNMYEVNGMTQVSPLAVGTGDRAVTASLIAATSQTMTCPQPNQLPDEFGIWGCAAVANMGAGLSSGPTNGWTEDTAGNAAGLLWCMHKVISAIETSSSGITWPNSVVTAHRMQTNKGYSLDGPWPLTTS